ncbi:uncharacterized protein K452DRAFT_297667 [Aplosporella prunicola CBS 121167]|uniref:Uncharacterized protein n=1 Tax=Aplosporella prunicola CBS 121167 TaxID=1176127 RepID=A0A6A6BG34_9PEZI|nr:uncharacterized protein K452DRAFT_297667 [Aplosporella prunicola CBS 121167]KAF2142363.1 hypothetical protein K452DRAFT_297667 [Aplosporella prunicola CBS 121167]
MGLPVWRAPSPADCKVAATRSPIRRRRSPAPSRRITLRRIRPADDGNPRRARNSAADQAFDLHAFLGYGTDSDRDGPPTAPNPHPHHHHHHHHHHSHAHTTTRPDEGGVLLYASSNAPDRLVFHARATPFSRAPDDAAAAPDSFSWRELRLHDLRRREGELRSRVGRLTRDVELMSAWPPSRQPPPPPPRRASPGFPSFGDAEAGEDPLLTLRRTRSSRPPVPDGPLPASSLRESWSPAIDGLGDRDRSVSPPNSDHWDTMLSTIAPDERLPTADSSFTSAAASASFSASNSTVEPGSGSDRSASAGSSHTNLTVPSRGQSAEELSAPLPAAGCDTEDEGNAASDNEDGMPSALQPLLHSARTGPWDIEGPFPEDDDEGEVDARAAAAATAAASAPTDGPPARDPLRYSSSVRSRSREATNMVRNYYALGRPSSTTPNAAPRATAADVPPAERYQPNAEHFSPDEMDLVFEFLGQHVPLATLPELIYSVERASSPAPADAPAAASPRMQHVHMRAPEGPPPRGDAAPTPTSASSANTSVGPGPEAGSTPSALSPTQMQLYNQAGLLATAAGRQEYFSRLDRNLANMRSAMRRVDQRVRALDERRAASAAARLEQGARRRRERESRDGERREAVRMRRRERELERERRRGEGVAVADRERERERDRARVGRL